MLSDLTTQEKMKLDTMKGLHFKLKKKLKNLLGEKVEC